jgi:DNA polymerase III sliding clamp (beta) subunit (PCNA family)
MLTSLKFCAGSVAKKDFVIDLKHFAIENGRIRGFNGVLALSTPIPFDIDCNPNAEQLIKAVSKCNDTIQLSLTKAGRLSVKSGVFKAFIDCVQGETNHVEPEGEFVNFDGELLLKGIQACAAFIGSDASRPWANGVLIKGQSIFATNNVMLVEYYLGSDFPITVNIPKAAVREMQRINEAPITAQVTERSITFHYTGDRWLRTQLYATEWPDLSKVLNRPSEQVPLDERIFEGLESVKAFVDKMGTIFLTPEEMRTHADEQEGAGFALEGFGFEGKYNIEMLNLLKDTATTIDWSTYPGPCMFQGDRIRGAIIGMRK